VSCGSSERFGVKNEWMNVNGISMACHSVKAVRFLKLEDSSSALCFSGLIGSKFA
jgi:molybdopterin-guanine dinucleotide biosynthesis protein A